LLNQVFALSDSGDQFFRYRIGTREASGTYQISSLGQSGLRLAREDRLEAGMCHAARSEVLHRIIVPDEQPVVTVFCQGPRKRVSTDMFSERAWAPGAHRTPALRLAELRHVLERIRRALRVPAYA
jgi:hypothetical protein